MSSSKIKAGEAFVEIGARKGILDSVLNKARSSLKSFAAGAAVLGTPMLAIGASAATAAASVVSSFVEAGSALDDMSQRTGASVESLSALGYAAQMSGSSIETVEKAITTMGKQITAAGKGSKGAQETLNGLGLSIKDLEGLTVDQRFLAISDRLSQIEDPGQRSATAMKIFGKAGAELVPILADGADGISKMMDEAKSLGVVMQGEDASAAATLGDSVDKLWMSFNGIINTIGAALIPIFQSLADRALSVITIVSNFIAQNRGLIVVAAQVAAVIGVAGAALLAIAGTAAVVGAALGGLAAVAGFVTTAFTFMASVIGAILSPIGLVIVAIAALGAAIIYYSGAGSAMLDWLGSQFQVLLDFVMPVIDGIKTALTSGQFAAAGKVLFTFLELAFRTGTQRLYGIWLDSMVMMQNLWTDLSGAITDNFGGAINWAVGAWQTAVNSIAKSLLYLYSLFDRSVDYEAAAKGMDADLAKQKKAREEAGFATKDQREAIKQKRRDDAAANKDDFASRIAELEETLSSDLAEINKTAEKQAEEAAKPTEPKLPQLEDLRAKAPTPEETAKATSVGGTFSGFAAGLLGSGVSTFDRMLDESKKTNELLGVVADNTADMGDLEFSA